ncbi:hypothetical protein [Desulfitibacter alkalitolerans]|uniref:hypothetical protein n=1 Tax=Desulfitibacter alkalitolerans TaxID=264641 RepID=UPI000483AA6A|nr:hypothetical protein [Desulfitibacter alkalitolerans]
MRALDGYIKYFNHEFVKKLGYPPNEVLNEHFSRFRYVGKTRSKFRSLNLLNRLKSDGLLELLSEERYSELVSFENVLVYVQEVVNNGNHDDISAVCVTIK